MTRAVVPTANLNRRLPTVGRLRMGVKVDGTTKAGKAYQRPTSIQTWRLTSHDEAALEQVAAIYGGAVKPWNEPKADPGQFEVVTDASELRVVLPPDPLGGSPIYELWSGGGCQRRCDGLSCEQIVKGPDGAERVDVPCLCAAQGSMACDPHTRLSVILPDVRFGGVWMLDTKGWDAAQELPGMVSLLQEMQGRGLTVGLLRLEHRRKVIAGETRNFPVPVLALSESMDALASGGARYQVGASSSAPALAPGSTPGDVGAASNGPLVADTGADLPQAHDSDDEIIDAEVVQTLADVLPADVTDTAALVAARNVARAKGMELPTSVEQVTDPAFCALVLDELGLLDGDAA